MKKLAQKTGSVSWGTMREEDLIPEFCATLRDIGIRSRELTQIENRISPRYFNTEKSAWDLEWLFEKLNECAPEGCYFGAHPGDGSDYGFWENEPEYSIDPECEFFLVEVEK